MASEFICNSSAIGEKTQEPLPSLRSDIEILEGSRGENGAPQWLIYDAVRHKYFSIGSESHCLLMHWQSVPAEEFSVNLGKIGQFYQVEDIEAVARFLVSNGLTVERGRGEDLYNRWLGTRKSVLHKAIHGYLFFRIPLVRPDRFLNATYPIISFVFRPWFAKIMMTVTLIGLYLAGRQWDVFSATLIESFTLSGLLSYGLALIAVKALHELGHAYTAVRHGCRVPSMGLAFMVLYPLLYSDVTDAWRLKSPKKRLQIAAAGMVAELALAGLAIFMWSFLPDGPVRSACFFIAAVSWTIGLAVNLNPFMKFDGYYILSDMLGVSNLQSRSSALGRWWLRRFLFDIESDKPEPVSPGNVRILILYAYSFWIYRLFLFIGIALLVYYLTFKALGIFLFTVEILFFIVLPIFRELKVWWNHRREILSMKRGRLTLGILTIATVLLFAPFSTTLRLPAVVQPIERARILPPNVGVIQSLAVSNGDRVSVGEILATLTSRSLDYEIRKATAKLTLARFQTMRAVAEPGKESLRGVRLSELKTEQEAIKGLNRDRSRMVLRAPISGVVNELVSGTAVGDAVSASRALMKIEGRGRMEAVAYLNEQQVLRWRDGNGRFVPDILSYGSVDVEFVDLDLGGLASLPHPELASVFGGGIPVEQSPAEGNELKPRGGLYRARFLVSEKLGSTLTGSRGVLHVEGKSVSAARRIYQQIMLVFLREASF